MVTIRRLALGLATLLTLTTLAPSPATASPGPSGWGYDVQSWTYQSYAGGAVTLSVAVDLWRPCTNCAATWARGFAIIERKPPITGVKVTDVAIGIVGGDAIMGNSTDALDHGKRYAESYTPRVRIREDYGPIRLRARGNAAHRSTGGSLVPLYLLGDPAAISVDLP